MCTAVLDKCEIYNVDSGNGWLVYMFFVVRNYGAETGARIFLCLSVCVSIF